MKTLYLIAPIAALVLTSCDGPPKPLQSTPTLTVVEEHALPAPTRVDQTSQTRPYLVGPYDTLVIDVFGIKDLSDRQVQVDASGHASFPLVGSFEAAGKTPREIEAELTQRLQTYVRAPQVSVNLKETLSQVITVDGQVMKPGLYPVVGNMSLIQAVATAGGAGEFAKLEDVVVLRNADGKRYAALYNLAAIRRGYYDDPQMYAGDIVIVGDSKARRMFRDFLAAAPLLTAPLIALLQNHG